MDRLLSKLCRNQNSPRMSFRGPLLLNGGQRNMQLSAVILARVFAFIEPVDLNPRGRAHYPELVSAVVERYGFMKYPQVAQDFDETKGVQFEMGRDGEVTISSIQIYTQGIVVDTASSTDDSDRVLHEALLWLKAKFGM